MASLAVALLLSVNLTSCGSDDDEPNPSNPDNKITFLSDIVGTWLAEDGSNDYIAVVTNTVPSNFEYNRMVCYWDGLYTNMGVPTFSFDVDHYTVNNAALKLQITKYNAKAGTMTVYNPVARETKNFRVGPSGNLAKIKNDGVKNRYSSVTVSVYSEKDPVNPIYTTNIGELTFLSSTPPFWTGGGNFSVKAEMVNFDSKETEYAEWNNLNANTYYVLNL